MGSDGISRSDRGMLTTSQNLAFRRQDIWWHIMRKRLLGGFVFAVLIGAGFWISLVVNYESDLGTDNVLSVGYSTPCLLYTSDAADE